ncbi:MAG: hypothetical protein M3R02_12070 [Chloroflexota bacterium]|nr:hypothetical protein [Chloroflexota bacterium]
MKTTPLALKAAIPTTESAIKFGGGKGEACRITLDVYSTDADVPQLLNLRGKRLYVVFTEATDGDAGDATPAIELPPISAIRLDPT